MTAATEAGVEQELSAAGHRVLEMFVAVCHAPDDPVVAAEANQALTDLQAVLDRA